MNDKSDITLNSEERIQGKKLKPTVAPEKKKDVDLKNTLYDNIINAGMNSVLNLSAIESFSQASSNRNTIYNLIDTMCEDPRISGVVEAYAEDATETNDAGDVVWVESDDPEVTDYVEFCLDSMNVNKNIYKWVYSLCKYGDLYLRLYRESDYEDPLFGKKKKSLKEAVKIVSYKPDDRYVHYMEMVPNPAEMFELTRFGKTIGYVKAPVQNEVVQPAEVNSFMNYVYRFKKEDVTLYPATEFVHAAIEDGVSREQEKVNIFLDDVSYQNNEKALEYSVRRGNSLLADVYTDWRNLSLMEASVLLNRVTKSSIVRLINVEVGDMPKENVSKTLNGVKRMIEQKSAINQGNSMSEYTNPGPVENNVYVPTHDGIGAITTTQVGGDVDVKSLADLDYYLNKLYGGLRTPKQYFNWTDDSTGFNGGTSLSIISSPFAKMIKRIQNTIIQCLTDAVNLMILDQGLDAYINKFRIRMLPPTTQEELDRRENMSGKVQLSSDIMGMLSEIENSESRLKILKSLLQNIVDDNEIISIIQQEIDKIEHDNTVEKEREEMVEETPPEKSRDEIDLDFSRPRDDSSFDLDMSVDTTEEVPEPENNFSNEVILPTPAELDTDLTTSD